MAGSLDALTHLTFDGALQLRGGISNETATGAVTLDSTYGNIIMIDPGGAGRDVSFAAFHEVDGAVYVIVNRADAAEDLTVKDSGASTIGTVSQNEIGLCCYTGSAWLFFVITGSLS